MDMNMTAASNTKLILYSLVCLCFVSEVGAPGGSVQDLLTYAYTCDQTNGYCYHAFDVEVTYSEAWYRCHAIGMHLAMPKTQTQIDFIQQSITGTEKHVSVWMGMTDTITETEFMWQDQQPVIKEDSWWKAAEPKDSKEHDEDCVEILQMGWNNARCTKLNRYICERRIIGDMGSHSLPGKYNFQAGNVSPCPLSRIQITNTCSEGSPYTFGDKCYQIITGEYIISMSRCQDLGGQLAMPKTTAINNFIKSINYGDEQLWIGIDGSLQALRWLDGEYLTAEQLANFLNPPATVNTMGNYTAHTTTNGKWIYLEKNATSKLSYVCEYSFPKTGVSTTVIPYVCATPDVCPYPESGINANVNVMSLSEGSIIVYTCLTGYTLVAGNLSSVCVSIGAVLAWNGSAPECQVLCPEPDVNANSSYVMSSNLYVLGITAIYSCDLCCDNTASNLTRVCHGVGLWTGNAPNCSDFENGNCWHNPKYGYVAEYINTCQQDGTWSLLPSFLFDESLWCPESAHDVDMELNLSELEQNLTVDKTTLSKTRRQKTSADNHRTSAKCMGLTGALILTTVFGWIVFSDILKIYRCGRSIGSHDMDNSDIIFIYYLPVQEGGET